MIAANDVERNSRRKTAWINCNEINSYTDETATKVFDLKVE